MKHKIYQLIITIVPLLFVGFVFLMIKPALSLASLNQQGVLAPSSLNEGTPTWAHERIDAEKTFGIGTRSIVLDSNGDTHIAYGGDRAYYAYNDGSGWQLQTIDYAWGTSGSAIAVDHNDIPHVSYYDKVNHAVKYAYYNGTSWTTEVITQNMSIDFGSIAIDVDSIGHPHIGYADSTNGLMKHTYYDGGQWTTSTIGRGSRLSLQIDSINHVHASYTYWNGVPGSDIGAGYAYWDSNQWVTATIQTGPNVGRYPSLDVDSNEQPHMTYMDGNAQTLMYAYKASNSWYTDTIDNVTWAYNASSIQLDSNDIPHVSYNNTNTGFAYYATWTGTQWAIETSYDQERVFDTSLTLDSTDAPHIVFVGTTSDDLVYLTKNAGNWVDEIVDTGASLGGYSSMAIAPASPYTVHVSYAGDSLKHARFDGTTWQVEAIDSVWTWGGTAVALEPIAPYYPHILYYDETNDLIKHAYWTGSNWTIQVVDSPSLAAGTGLGLAFDPNSPYNLHAVYTSNTNVNHAIWNGTSWQTDIIETGGAGWWEVISSSSIAVDNTGTPHVSYHGGIGNGDLKYAIWTGTSWITESVEYTGNSGIQTSIALDSANNPHIGYSDPYEDEIMYAQKNSGTWTIEVVDAHSGEVSSIVIDTNDQPHLSYYQSDNKVLAYAFHDGVAWQLETVDDFVAGYSSSLALDENDFSRIAYMGGTSDLQVAWKNTRHVIPSEGGAFGTFGMTDFIFPSGTFTETVVITSTVLEEFGTESNAGIFYDIKATYLSSGLNAQPSPGQTYTVTVHYDQANVPTNVDESDLALFYWEGTKWIKEPSSVVDTVANTITATPSHFSIWAGLFKSDYNVYLPVLLRSE